MTIPLQSSQASVRQILPHDRKASVTDVITELGEAPTCRPFADEVVDFVAAFSAQLRRTTRGRPELQALAYWMRGAELHRLAADFARLSDERVVLVPRGTVFHVPPANVDTIFVYSWVLSVLVGNRNIVRLPRRITEQSQAILDVLRELLVDGRHPTVAAANTMISYEPEPAVTGALSSACDVRVIWGGDATVAEIRRSPLRPRAIELTFPDRFSMVAIQANRYLGETEEVRDAISERLFNDSYQFDQLGCSSPRLVVWVGAPVEADHARDDLFTRLAGVVARRGYRLDAAGSIGKLVFEHRVVLDLEVTTARRFGAHVTVLPVSSLAGVRGEFCGGGLFFELRCDRLLDLVNFVEPRDQTLSHFGFSRTELTTFAHAVNGRGIDRMVPIGEALTFDRIWDGHDLMQSLTRRTTIDISQVHLS
jgi:hypothetical protein